MPATALITSLASSTEPCTWTLCDFFLQACLTAGGLLLGEDGNTVNSLRDHPWNLISRRHCLNSVASQEINKYTRNGHKYSNYISSKGPFRKSSCEAEGIHLLFQVVSSSACFSKDHPPISPTPPTKGQAKACLLNTESFFLLVQKLNLLCYLRWITLAKIEPTESSSQGGGWQRWRLGDGQKCIWKHKISQGQSVSLGDF